MFNTIEIPFKKYGNHTVLTAEQVMNQPYLMDFINRFPKAFEYSPTQDFYIYCPPEKEKSHV